MRSNEERVAAVKRRSKEIEYELQRQTRRRYIILFSSVAASLAVIIGLSLAMSNAAASFSNPISGYLSMTAGIFQNSSALGYMIIGLIAFVLGVCVTVLCYRINHIKSEEILQVKSSDKKAENTPPENDHD